MFYTYLGYPYLRKVQILVSIWEMRDSTQQLYKNLSFITKEVISQITFVTFDNFLNAIECSYLSHRLLITQRRQTVTANTPLHHWPTAWSVFNNNEKIFIHSDKTGISCHFTFLYLSFMSIIYATYSESRYYLTMSVKLWS